MSQSSDPALERLVWLLAAAVAALVVRELWQALRDRRTRRQRDRLLLTALAREVLIIKGIASAIINDINRERAITGWPRRRFVDAARRPVPARLLSRALAARRHRSGLLASRILC